MLDRPRAGHHAVFDAVKAGPGKQAADMTEAHIRGFYVHLSRATPDESDRLPAGVRAGLCYQKGR